jgi:hypothetical protein
MPVKTMKSLRQCLLPVIIIVTVSLIGCGGQSGGSTENADSAAYSVNDEPTTDTKSDIEDVSQAADTVDDSGAGTGNTDVSSEDAPDLSSFDLRGTWKSVGETGVGQAMLST